MAFLQKTLCPLLLLCVLSITGTYAGEMLDFSNATVYASKIDAKELQKVILVLQEEIQKRSGILIKSSRKIVPSSPRIILTLDKTGRALPGSYSLALEQLESISQEGYKIALLPSENKVIIQAKTKRGALYGVGRLLRNMEIRAGKILIPESITLSSSPRYEIRGHQLGYRPKTNSYDAWSVAQFDQYIRELAIFGANSIEIMPPRTDDDFTSKHMQIPAIDMVREQSKICDECAKAPDP
jgi:hypothetical protein